MLWGFDNNFRLPQMSFLQSIRTVAFPPRLWTCIVCVKTWQRVDERHLVKANSSDRLVKRRGSVLRKRTKTASFSSSIICCRLHGSVTSSNQRQSHWFTSDDSSTSKNIHRLVHDGFWTADDSIWMFCLLMGTPTSRNDLPCGLTMCGLTSQSSTSKA